MQRIANAVQSRKYPAGTRIYHANEPSEGLYIIEKGKVQLLDPQQDMQPVRQRDLLTRLVWYLLLLADDFGIETKSGILIDLKLSHSALAELINSSHSYPPSPIIAPGADDWD